VAGDPSSSAPSDPEDWTDEEWIEWLQETDEELDYHGEEDLAAAPLVRRLTRSASGSALGAAMIGLRNAMYGQKDDDPVIIAEAPGGPSDNPVSLHLDPDHPERSVAIIRPSEASKEREPPRP
jgi:hypothetical protein